MSTDGISAFQTPGSSVNPYNVQRFLVESLINRMATSTLCKVVAVTNSGELSPVGFVDLQPLVNQVDGSGVAVPHAVVYHCPYFRLQGGANAIILDPQIEDVGVALFADRDISSVTANKGQANPGSSRRFSMADGLYLGGMLNGTPTQYVQFNADGIKLHSPTAINLDAPEIQFDCETLTINATTSTTITTPSFTVHGASTLDGTVHATGNTQLDGSAIVAGGAVLQSTLAVTGAAAFAAALVDGRTGKDIGGAHEHDHGTMTATGHTGIVI